MSKTGKPYKKKCPRCKRLRQFSGGRYGRRRPWRRVDGVLVCPWCLDPEAERAWQQERRDRKKAERKKQKAEKIAPFTWEGKRS